MVVVDMPPTGSLGGASGAAGTGGDGEEDEPVTLEGFVRLVTSADLVDVGQLTLPVDVIADAFPQGLRRETTEAGGSFLLEDVLEESALVVTVQPTAGSNVEIVPTLQAVDTTTVTDAELLALSNDMFLDLVEQSFTVNPTAFDSNLGAAIITFLDENGDPLDGVSLIAGNAGVVAYDNGAIYSDALEQTGGRGTLVLLNLVPTTDTLIRFTHDQLAYETRIPELQRGSVTLHVARPF